MNKLYVCRPVAPIFLVMLLAAVLAHPAHALKPEDDEVQAVIMPGVKFLESRGANYDRLGGVSLIGLVMYKHTQDKNNPLVRDAVKHVRGKLGRLNPKSMGKDNIYDIGLTTIFLAELDRVQYASEIECLLENLQLRQKPCGAWGYDERTSGDTSMTQYGVLSYWTAKEKGFDIPIENIEAVADWLLRTQDPSGAFGYQGRVSANYDPVKQSNVRHSMAAAGLGSVYICADILGLKSRAETPKETLAPALKRVRKKEPEKKEKRVKTRFTSRQFAPVQIRGNQWFLKNGRIDPPEWTYYYLYALERYMSYRELAERRAGAREDSDPKWYKDGFEFLKSQQGKNGSWKGPAKEVPCTCFALLFLLRSSEKSIKTAGKYGDGQLIGGRILPKDTDRVEIRDGKVIPKRLLKPAEEVIAILEEGDRDIDDYTRLLYTLPDVPRTEVEGIAAKHKDLLYQLAEHQSPEARVAALQTMARTRDFDYVPILIYVLATDPDKSIAREARDVLRRIARRPSGFGMPDEPDESNRRVAADAWKNWYLAVRPDAKFKKSQD